MSRDSQLSWNSVSCNNGSSVLQRMDIVFAASHLLRQRQGRTLRGSQDRREISDRSVLS